jgi:hypothetical protein
MVCQPLPWRRSSIDLTLFGADLDALTLARLDLSLRVSLQSPELIDHIERVGQVLYQRNLRTNAALGIPIGSMPPIR